MTIEIDFSSRSTVKAPGRAPLPIIHPEPTTGLFGPFASGGRTKIRGRRNRPPSDYSDFLF